MAFENGRVVEVVLRAALGKDSQINTFHYDLHDATVAEGGSANDPQALADRFRDDVLPVWSSRFNSNWQIQPVVVREVKDPLAPNKPRSEWFSGAVHAGTSLSGGDILPNAMCVVVKLNSSHIGRRYTGRLFIGGVLTESDQTNAQWSSGQLAAVDQLMQTIPKQPDIADGISASVANWSVYSRTNRAQNITPYVVPITSWAIRALPRWLRSRQY